MLFIKHLNIVGVVFLLGHYDVAMTSPSLQIPSFKISIAAMFVATLGFFSSTAEAVIVVTDSDKNPDKDEAYATSGGAFTYYQTVDTKEKKGDVFLSTQATGQDTGGTTSITGYNDSSSEYAKDFTSITLEDAGSLVYNDQLSVAFYLDINQTGTGSEQPYYEIHALEIYTSASAEFDYFDYKDNDTTYPGVSTVYKFDGVLRLQPDNTKGTSNWDAALYVPYENFKNGDLSAAQTYIHFVVTYEDNAGFDTWSVAECGTLVPEPSSALLVSLGGLIGLLRRRR